jgi:hypothetical protein
MDPVTTITELTTDYLVRVIDDPNGSPVEKLIPGSEVSSGEGGGDVTAHLADTADAHDASAISVLDTLAQITATDVEGALAEIFAAFIAHLADSSDAHDASAVSVLDAGTLLTATNVEAALAELATSIQALNTSTVGRAVYSAGWPARPDYDTVIWTSTDRAATTPVAATGTDIVILPPTLLHWDFPLSSTGPTADAVVTGDAVVAWRTPYAITVTAVETWLEETSSSGNVTADLNEGAGAGTTILSTLPTIQAGELSSADGTPAVVSDTALAAGARITWDITAAGTDAHGLWGRITGYPT